MIVCVCNRINETQVREAARAGCASPEAAYAGMDCEVQCGCCLDYAQEIIDAESDVRSHLRFVTAEAA